MSTYNATMIICTKDILKFLNLGEGGYTKPTSSDLSVRIKVHSSVVEPFLTLGTVNHLVSCIW